VTGADSRTGLYLNGATIMTTPTDRHVRIAREAGFAGVEVRAERLLGADNEVEAAARTVDPGEVWSLNGIQIKVDQQGRLRHDLIDDELEPRLAVCRTLGARYLLVVPPRIAGVDAETALGGIIEGLAIVHDRAAGDGIRVAFEFLGFADSPINTPVLAASVVAAVPGAELVLDSCHWHASGAPDLAGFPIDRLAMVHLNDAPAKPPRTIEDADRVFPSFGVIDLARLVGLLRSKGYGGPWSVETFNPDYWAQDAEAVAAEGFRRSRQVLDAVDQ
jgi:2-keto-myo-inositol isomerase